MQDIKIKKLSFINMQLHVCEITLTLKKVVFLSLSISLIDTMYYD